MKITKTDKILIPTVVLFLLFWYIYSNYFTKNMIIGTYVKERTLDSYPEVPSGIDTLILFDDGHYESHYYWHRKGTYEIYGEPFATRIELTYYEKISPDGKIGLAGYNSYFTRWWFSRIRIILNSDLGVYYEKID
jgi:hypothetical protein